MRRLEERQTKPPRRRGNGGAGAASACYGRAVVSKHLAVPIGKTIAVLSDVHGNLRALDAVLADLARRDVTEIYVAGDHLFGGGEPLDVWRRLSASKAILSRSLGDLALATLDPERVAARSDEDKKKRERLIDTRRVVGELVLKALAKLPPSVRVPLADGREVLVVHGAPTDPGVDVTHDLSDEEMLALLGHDPADIVAVGGSHVPFQRDFEQLRVVGVGSVGEAPEGKNAHFVLITPNYEGTIVEEAWVEY